MSFEGGEGPVGVKGANLGGWLIQGRVGSCLSVLTGGKDGQMLLGEIDAEDRS